MAMSSLLRIGVLAAMAPGAWSQVTVAIQPLSVPVTIAEDEVLRSLTVRLQDFLAGQVVKLPHVRLLDRQNIAKLLQEQHFVAPTSMDRVAADNIGRMLRVDVMLLVSFYRLPNAGMFSKLAGEKRCTASAEAVEVATGRVVAKAVCGGIAAEAEVHACAEQIAREFQRSVASLWNIKQQQAKAQAEAQQLQVKAQAEAQQQEAKAQAEAQSAATARLQKDEEQRRVAAQQKAQAMRVEELRQAETLQRERTEEARLSLQRLQEEKAQQEARARLNSDMERVKARFSDLAGEANAMLDYWTRIEREVQRQRGGYLRSEIRSATARLRSDMGGADDSLKRRQLSEALSYMEKARKEIDTLEQMK